MTADGQPRPGAAAKIQADMQNFALKCTDATLFDWLETKGYSDTPLTHVTKPKLAALFQGESNTIAQLVLLRDMAVEMLALDPARRVVPSELVARLPPAYYTQSVAYAKPDVGAMLQEPRSLAMWHMSGASSPYLDSP